MIASIGKNYDCQTGGHVGHSGGGYRSDRVHHGRTSGQRCSFFVVVLALVVPSRLLFCHGAMSLLVLPWCRARHRVLHWGSKPRTNFRWQPMHIIGSSSWGRSHERGRGRGRGRMSQSQSKSQAPPINDRPSRIELWFHLRAGARVTSESQPQPHLPNWAAHCGRASGHSLGALRHQGV